MLPQLQWAEELNLTALGTSPRPGSNQSSVCPLRHTAKDVRSEFSRGGKNLLITTVKQQRVWIF